MDDSPREAGPRGLRLRTSAAREAGKGKETPAGAEQGEGFWKTREGASKRVCGKMTRQPGGRV